MIEVAVQKGTQIFVYGNGNHPLFSRTGTLVGYTSSTVTIRQGNNIITYNEKGSTVSHRSA